MDALDGNARRASRSPVLFDAMRLGATHFLMKTLPRVAAEMALHVLAYNLTRVMNIMGVQPLMAAMRFQTESRAKLGKKIKHGHLAVVTARQCY